MLSSFVQEPLRAEFLCCYAEGDLVVLFVYRGLCFALLCYDVAVGVRC